MEKESLVNKFLEEYERGFSCTVLLADEIKNAKRVYKVTKPKDCFLYIKERNSEQPFWGITKNILDELNRSSKQYYIVLLSQSVNYLIEYVEFKNIITQYEPNDDGDYKITPNHINDKNGVFEFDDFKDFRLKICILTKIEELKVLLKK